MPSFWPNFNGHDVRVVMIDGAPWWVAVDICRVLGIVNTATAVRPLSDDEYRTEGVDRIDTSAFDLRIKKITLVSESGLYKLIMRSDKPEARAFQDWVTRVVLPAIQRLRRSRSDKDGAYIMGEEKVATGEETKIGPKSRNWH